MEGQVALSQPAEHKDRSGWLVFFGILQILLGALAGLMVPFTLLALALSSHVPGAIPMRFRDMVLGILVYAGAAVFFVWMGVGTIKVRRWARTLMLVVSWIWLIIGAFVLVFLVLVLPHSLPPTAAGRPQPPPALMAFVFTVVIGFIALTYVVLPLVFVLFYRSKHVRATVEHRDPVERWTDRCPLPVLALSLLLAWGGLATPIMSFARPVFPFFGMFVSGPAATAVWLMLAPFWVYLAWAVYRLKPMGWWGTVVLQVIFLFSSVATFWNRSLEDLYQHMEMSPQQMQVIHNMPFFQGRTFVLWILAISLGNMAFILSLHRYFVREKPA